MSLTCLFGGTFNPIHNGHLFLADEARHVLGSQRIVFIPNRTPPHKESPRVDAAARQVMLKAAVDTVEGFEIDQVELEREGPSFTIHTLESYPSSERLAFLCGADAFLYPWHRLNDVLERLEVLLLANRAGFEFRLPPQLEALPPHLRDKIRLLEFPDISISSSDIRRRVREGRAFRFLVPEPVYRIILSHGHYLDSGSVELASAGNAFGEALEPLLGTERKDRLEFGKLRNSHNRGPNSP